MATKAVLDPEGVALGYANPFAPPPDSGEEGEGMSQAQMNSRYAQLLPPSLGGGIPGQLPCRLNGFLLGCGAITPSGRIIPVRVSLQRRRHAMNLDYQVT